MRLATLDLEKLRARFDDDEALLEEIFRVFLAEAPERRDGLQTAVAAGDMDRLVRLSHSLKGVAGTIVAEELRQAAYAVEMAARAGETAKIGPLVATLLDLLARTVKELQQYF